MRHLLAIGLVGLSLVFSGGSAAEPENPLAGRKASWQRVLDQAAHQFSEGEAGMLFSLSQCQGDCQIHMVYDPAKQWLMTYKFVRDGKVVLEVVGHTGSAFRTSGNVLYFAHFGTSTQGCVVTAHDLKTGKKLWETTLNAVGRAPHFRYANAVTMGISVPDEGDEHDEYEGAVHITGRESYGDYIEILDRRTGTILAHKVYRKR